MFALPTSSPEVIISEHVKQTQYFDGTFIFNFQYFHNSDVRYLGSQKV